MTTDAGALESAMCADRAAVETRCGELLDALASQHEPMQDAMAYSLLGGGKRLRPLLCLWTHDLAGGSRRDEVLDIGCAIECVHTYSLVHDDLPCMDDDDLRRGKPSSHRRWGEATAVLVGDALLNLAYEILSTLPFRHQRVDPDLLLGVMRVLSAAAGSGGLITGQALDLTMTDGELDDVVRIHENKTARLISASMEAGAVMAGSDESFRGRIREAGLLVGRAFQIVDDVLDTEVDKETLGKTPGKDVRTGKLTYPAVVGVEESRRQAALLAERAVEMLPRGSMPAGRERAGLAALLTRLVERRS